MLKETTKIENPKVTSRSQPWGGELCHPDHDFGGANLAHCSLKEKTGNKTVSGFTLVELMIVVAIIGVLAAVALPSYQSSVRSGVRAEAQSLLLHVASNQERFYSDNNSYSANANPQASPAVATLTTESGLYQVSVAACGSGAITNCFIATATPQGNQTADSCTTLTLTNTGLKGATGDSVENCWR